VVHSRRIRVRVGSAPGGHATGRWEVAASPNLCDLLPGRVALAEPEAVVAVHVQVASLTGGGMAGGRGRLEAQLSLLALEGPAAPIAEPLARSRFVVGPFAHGACS
jgi:hypothetical protein